LHPSRFTSLLETTGFSVKDSVIIMEGADAPLFQVFFVAKMQRLVGLQALIAIYA